MNNFYSMCQQQFEPDKVFIRGIGKHFSFAEVDGISASYASWLGSQGLTAGDRVILQVEKSPQNLFWYFACLRAGLIYLPLNTAYQPRELEYFVSNANPSLVICDPAQADTFNTMTNCPVFTLDAEGQFSADIPDRPSFDNVAVGTDALAVILYTSGTTGNPKGAMITHGNLLANASALTDAWQWSKDDVLLHALPVFHIHGLFVATHLALLNGSSMIFVPRFSPETVIEELPNSTVFMGVPTHYTRLLAHKRFNREACRNMRLFTSGSAPLLSQTFEQMQTQTGHQIVERYGMTETGMNTSNPLEGVRKPGTVGPALPGVDIKILDSEGEPVGIDEPGNLLVRGANVFKGYWQMPEKTAEEFDNKGFFRTGDVASLDGDGYVSIVGRDKDMVISGGLNVYPKEIESIIDRVAGVLESAVIGLKDADFGEAVTAIVVLDPANSQPLTEAGLMAQIKPLLANFKQPKHIYMVESLPRNAMGKVQKNLLRQKFEHA